MKTIKEIVDEYLVANNLDGLFNEDNCSCLRDDLFCCDEPKDDCTAGKLSKCEDCSSSTYDEINGYGCRDGNDYCIVGATELSFAEKLERLGEWEALILQNKISEVNDEK